MSPGTPPSASTKLLAHYKADAEKFETAMRTRFAAYFDTGNSDAAIAATEGLYLDALLAALSAALHEAEDPSRVENEENKKLELAPETAPTTVAHPIKDEARLTFSNDHPDMDLQPHHFLADILWDIIKAMLARQVVGPYHPRSAPDPR
jgi:hypothetical protein